MLPDSACSMSAGGALGFLSKAARIATTKPGVQKPHCCASNCTNAAGTASSWSLSTNASAVLIGPFASSASVVHAYTGLPFIITVHAPQVPRSQTRLQLVTLRKSRSVSSSVVRGSTFVVTSLPLTFRVSFTGPGPMPGTVSFLSSGLSGLASKRSGLAVSADAAAETPEPDRNCRRDMGDTSGVLLCGSLIAYDPPNHRDV